MDLATILVACVALLYRLQPHARAIEGNLLYLARIEPQLRSVRSMLQTKDKTRDSHRHLPVRALHRCIRFDGVCFRYADGLPLFSIMSGFGVPGRPHHRVGGVGVEPARRP